MNPLLLFRAAPAAVLAIAGASKLRRPRGEDARPDDLFDAPAGARRPVTPRELRRLLDSHAALDDVDLRRASMARADLRGRDLSRRDLRHADLRSAVLVDADLSGAISASRTSAARICAARASPEHGCSRPTSAGPTSRAPTWAVRSTWRWH